ncbi:MAG: CmcJ/NvfI family oxidoreductase [Steroidobacteraceae bacterium]
MTPRDSTAPEAVRAVVNYTGPMSETPRYHAHDHSRDVHVLDPQRVTIRNARALQDAPALDREGFALVPHASRVTSFLDAEQLQGTYAREVEQLICEVTGACAAAVVAKPFVRFAESSSMSGRLDNSMPARFVHIDYSDARARGLAEQHFPAARGRPAHLGRYAHYNLWRVLSQPPQDVPLAVCSARAVADADLVAALAVFDFPGVPERTADSLVVRHNPAHQWHYFRDMRPDEALIFVTKESDPDRPHQVPHSAFDDPSCPPGAAPRSSIEIRVVAYFAA